jgi:phage terminase large subunit-like protein
MCEKDIQSELIEYCKKVLYGDIVACKKYKWACMRFLRDIDNIGHPDWPWVFNNKKAYNYIDGWVHLFIHSKGPLAGKIKVFTPYERFVYGNIYGWEHKETGYRRFRRSYEQVARKNAKSQDKAIQALWEMSGFGEEMAEVYVAATKKEQTRFVWAEASWLFQHSRSARIREAFKCKYDKELLQVIIRHDKSSSFFSRLSKDDKKSGDGSNPHFVILDEYHLHPTTEYYDQATSGQKLRVNPLLSIITTAGFDLNNPCYRIEYQYACSIIDPDNPIENDRYFVAICELDKNDTTETIEINGKRIEPGQPIDDLHSHEAILKTNPILATSDIGIESIQNELAEAEGKPEKMRDVLTKTFNFWIQQRDAGYMDMARWKSCCRPEYDIPIGKEVVPFCGVDLSSTIDLTSVGFIINLPDSYHFIISHSFMPEDNVARAADRDNIPYHTWIDDGYISATPGSEVDYHLVIDWIVKQYDKYGWSKGEVCYDKHLATWLKQEMENRSFTPVEISQSYTGLSLATKEFRAKVYNNKVIYLKDPLLNWTMGNAIIRCGPSENIMIDKGAAKYRIDPVAALINAFVRAIANEKVQKKGGRVFIL